MAIYTVTTLDDETSAGGDLATEMADGNGLSLREALALANGTAGADTVNFAPALAGGTLYLTTGQQLSITTNGITINGDINGDGTPDITISADSADGANDAAGVFFIDDGAASTISATLNGLVIRDGRFAPASPMGGGISVGNGDALTLTNAVISDNLGAVGGGIGVGKDASLTVINSVITNNAGPAFGGGIYGDVNSDITLIESTVSNNSAVFLQLGYGGGIHLTRGATLSLTSSTISGNRSGSSGGGISEGFGGSNIILTNSTVSGNVSIYGTGGGLAVGGSFASTSVSLINSTVSGNSAQAGGGLDAFASVLSYTSVHITLGNSIIAGNRSVAASPTPLDPDVLFSGPITVAHTGGNIVGGTLFNGNTVQQTGIALADIFSAIDPATGGGQLADNGGPVQTIALNPQVTNPAINTGTGTLPADTHDLDGDNNNTEALPVDARGEPRSAHGMPDLGAFEVQSLSLVVTTLDDELDAADTDLTTANVNDLSLREALALANGDPDAATITFAAGLTGGTLFLSSDQQLSITTDGITIDGDTDGDGDADITIDADSGALANDAASRVFFISDGAATTISATLNGLVIRDGNAGGGRGGGIYVGSADALTLTNATVSDNSAGYAGGGIYGHSNAAITLRNATVSGNSGGVGGGIAGGNYAAITLSNTTVSGNSGIHGGGIYGRYQNAITLINSTVTGNSATSYGGGTYNVGPAAVTTLTNSIVAGNVAVAGGDDLFGGYDRPSTLTFTGGNVIGSTPHHFATTNGAPTAQIDGANQAALETVFATVALVDPDFCRCARRQRWGVQTVALAALAYNPALDAGDDSLDPAGDKDARGLPRVDQPNAANNGTNVSDLGAYELQAAAAASLVVTTSDDVVDPLDNETSLREALALANSLVNGGDALDDGLPDVITFDPSLAGDTIVLVGGELVVSSDLTIVGDTDGDGAADITIDGGGLSRVFNVTSGTSTLESLVIIGGDAGTGLGGGVRILTGATLTIANTIVANNDANRGGGIYNDGTLTLLNSTLSGNTAAGPVGDGGGLHNHSTAVVTNVTLANNSATMYGGGMVNVGTATLTNTTVSGNTASDAAGILTFNNLTLVNSIVLGHVAPGPHDDIWRFSGSVTYAGANIVGIGGDIDPGPDGVMNAPSSAAVFADVGVNGGGLLADNGGLVTTIALNRAATNPALDIGSATRLNEVTAGLDLNGDGDPNDTITIDARGLPRVSGPGVDVGAFEVQNNAPVISSNGGSANAALAARENTTAITTVTASDLDNDAIIFSIVGGADAARFRINAATGVLSFITAPDFKSPTDVGRNNGYEVRVRASDGALFDDQAITVNVTNEAGYRFVDSGDINGDGRDDLLWREESGEVLVWYATGGGQVDAVSLGRLDTVWTIVGLGDFNGDGRSEIVRRHANGELVVDGASRGILDNVWSIPGIGDFNGDGRDELVYRHANGELLVDGVSRGILDNVWSIAGVGDFNGDGRDELVYRRVNGELLVDGASRGILNNVWSIDGVGDFNGDGRDELVYRHLNGEVRIDGRSIGVADNSWRIEALPDFDRNGTSDLLWRNINGNVEINGRLLGHLDVI